MPLPLHRGAARRCAAQAAAVLLAMLACPAMAAYAPRTDAAQAGARLHSPSADLGLASQYRHRDPMRSGGKPAIQGGFDFSHESVASPGATELYAGIGHGPAAGTF